MRKATLSVVLGIAVIVLAFVLYNLIAGSKKERRPQPKKIVKTVFVDTVENGSVPIVVSANGNLVAKRRVELFAEVQGVLKPGSRPFKPGERYGKGESLIRMDASEYYANVQSAKSDLYNQITSLMPDLRLDYPEVFPKWQDYLRGFDLEKAVPKLPIFDSEKEKFFISGRGIVTSYYNVKNLEQRLTKYTIPAPFDGILTEALVTEGTLVRAGQKLGEYINTEVYELGVSVTKSHGDYLEVGKQVQLHNLDGTKTYTGTVSRVNGRVDQDTQTIAVFIEVPGQGLREGQYLEAELEGREESDAIEIDRSLLLENNQIYTVKDSILAVLEVDPVYFSTKKAVLKNVPNGEIIVSKPIAGGYPGMLVKVFNKNTTIKGGEK